MSNRKTSIAATVSLLASVSLGSIAAHADPAVFFNEDLNAGLQTFLDTAAIADAAYNSANPSGPTQTSLIFQYDLTNISGYRFSVTDTSATETIYVQTNLGGNPATNNSTGDEGGDGFTNWSVSYASGDFNSAINAGYELSFFTDASYSTPYLINAVGLHVSDWGTCCTTGNTTPGGSLSNASEIYMVFDGSSPLLVGGISSTIGGEEHFVAAIDDRNAFSSVILAPNGIGEYFGAGGSLVFSTLALNSVPAGSSVVTVGSKIGPSDTATPDDIDNGTYTPNLDGGTLQFTEDGEVTTALAVESGGTLDTGDFDVELSGNITGNSTGPLVKTGNGSLTLSGTNSYTGGTTVAGGTLIGSTSSLTGDMLNNAALVIDQTTDGSFGGDVSGSGSLTKSGTGAVTLTGSNSYTGGTTVAGGTLIGSTASLTGNVLNNAALVIDQNTDGSFGGDVSGSGSLTKSGTGAVTLTGSNSYTGGTTVAGGTLIGSTSSLTGDVLNNAALVIDQTTDGSFGGDVSGSGSLTKSGTGAVTLTGSNSYTGGTTVAGGTLIGSTASLTGNVLNNAALVIDQNTDGSFGGDVSGSGSLTKSGTGAVTLTGSNSYTGGTTISGGALIGSTSSLTGDVLNNAALVIDQNTDGSFGGDVSGSGSLTKSGTGAVTLTGSNSYTGGTTISGGALIGSTTSLTGDVLNYAVLVIDQNTDGSFGGDVSGSGSLTKSGTGAVTLTGSNSYTGGTTISGGTLIGSTASLTGNVLNNAALVIDQNTDGSFGGDVSGSGSLTKSGTGAVTLTGSNSYTGGTTISGGTLIGSTASLTGDVLNNAVLVIDQNTDGSFGGTLSGTGTLGKTGSGTVVIDGVHAFSGATTVSQGGLTVDGDLRNSAISLLDGTVLNGAGIVGGIDARSGATVAVAGDDTGLLLVNGDVAFAPGSNLIVNANAAGQADVLNAAGTVSIAGGTVQVLAAEGEYAPQTGYAIVTAAAVEGRFDTVTTDLAFLMPTLQYSANGVGLILTRNDVEFADIAATVNQASVGTAIDAAFAAESDLYYAIVGQSAQGARTVLDTLSGEIHATVANAAVQDSERNRRAVLGRLNLPKHDGPALWIQGVAAKDEWSSDRNAAGYRRDATGVIGGLELTRGQSVVGIAVGYSDGDLRVNDRLSNAEITGKHLDIYAGSKFGRVTLAAGGQIADFDVETDRTLSFGAIDQQADASYDAMTYGAFARAGIQFALGTGAIEPFVGVNYVKFDRDGFAETGGTLALTGRGENSDWTYGSLGFKSLVPLDAAKRFSVSMTAEWQHALGNRDTSATMAFASGDPAFTIAGTPLAKDAALADIALNYRLSDRFSAGLGYSGTIADYGMSNAVRGTVSIAF